jgi:type I restriction enzyme M protein
MQPRPSTARAEGVVYHLLERLRGRLSQPEALTLIGQLAIWAHLTQPRIPPAPQAVELFPTNQLASMFDRDIFRKLKGASPRSQNIRLAFEEGVPVRYERLDAQVVGNLTCDILSHVSGLPAVDFAEDIARHSVLTTRTAHVTTTSEIAEFMLQLTGAQRNERVHCLGVAAESVAIACMRAGNVPILVAPDPPWMALVYALLTDSEVEFKRGDPLDFSSEGLFPPKLGATLALPPLGTKELDMGHRAWRRSQFDLQSGEGLYIESIDESAEQTAVILTSNRFLFTRGPEELLRRHLIDRDRIRAVISFPAGLLSSTYVPFTLIVLGKPRMPGSIVFCKIDEQRHVSNSAGKLRSQDRRFIARSEVLQALDHPDQVWCRAISRDEIRLHDYVLAVDRYFSATQKIIARATARRPVQPLGAIVEIVKPQALRSVENGHEKGVVIFEVSPAELPEYEYLQTPTRERLVDPQDIERHGQQALRPGDVLLSVKGTIGKSAVAGAELPDIQIFPSQSSVILRLKPRAAIADPVALLMHLRSPLFQSLLQSVVTGTTIPNVTLGDLRALPIVIPTVEEQRQLREVFETQSQLQSQIHLLQIQQHAAAAKAWDVLELSAPEKIA